MLAVPVLASSTAYARAESQAWKHRSLEDRPRLAPCSYVRFQADPTTKFQFY